MEKRVYSLKQMEKKMCVGKFLKWRTQNCDNLVTDDCNSLEVRVGSHMLRASRGREDFVFG